MRAALIAPEQLLDVVQPFSDYHLVLTHRVIYNSRYCNWCRQRSKAGDWILLDNSAREKNGRSVPMKDITLAALLIRPSTVFLPDFMFDGEGSLDELENALRSPHVRTLRRFIPDLKFAAVVQGLDVSEWLECFDILNDTRNGIDVLGIPMLTTQLFGSRVECLAAIEKKIHKSKKRCHLLGVWHTSDLRTVCTESQFVFVNGVDTSKPVRLAMQGKTLDDWGAQTRNVGDLDRRHAVVDTELVERNCREFVEICKGGQ